MSVDIDEQALAVHIDPDAAPDVRARQAITQLANAAGRNAVTVERVRRIARIDQGVATQQTRQWKQAVIPQIDPREVPPPNQVEMEVFDHLRALIIERAHREASAQQDGRFDDVTKMIDVLEMENSQLKDKLGYTESILATTRQEAARANDKASYLEGELATWRERYRELETRLHAAIEDAATLRGQNQILTQLVAKD